MNFSPFEHRTFTDTSGMLLLLLLLKPLYEYIEDRGAADLSLLSIRTTATVHGTLREG